MSCIIKAVKLRENAQLPAYGSEFAAGADLRACIDSAVELSPHETRMIPTGMQDWSAPEAGLPRGKDSLPQTKSAL